MEGMKVCAPLSRVQKQLLTPALSRDPTKRGEQVGKGPLYSVCILEPARKVLSR